MISFKTGKVNKVISKRKNLTELEVTVEGETAKAINYDELTGLVEEGDEVVLNTTAVELGLGTGGKHFVLWNLSRRHFKTEEDGHIVKLRYTPLQLSTLSVEEQESAFHSEFEQDYQLNCTPVIVGSLHSQLAAVAATVKELDPTLKLAYVMTDGGALPLVLSNLVDRLKSLKLIDKTITCGHAFGGDLEAVNIFSGLVAAKKIAKADIIVVIMGPGITGTDTPLGFSGIEQGQIINAVHSLRGISVAIPRLSFGDKRARHQGVSHHTITSLILAALGPAIVTLPKMDDKKEALVKDQLKQADITLKHKVEIIANSVTLESLKKHKLQVTTMGRSIEQEPEFFQAAGAAAIYAVDLLKGERGKPSEE